MGLTITSAAPHPHTPLAGRRVTVMGLGRHGGGVAAARFAAVQGARVTVTDLADEAQLTESLRELSGLPIERFCLNRHDEQDFRAAEVLVVNPAVRPDHRLLQVARQGGACLTSETELFLERCPARIIGVTGSNGKSTTAAMTAAILRAAGIRSWLGGNIGVSLLGQLAGMRQSDWVVLEISSFQLTHLSAQVRMPEVAVVTNCAPNHLDWHGTYEHYVASKQRLIGEQNAESLAVLNTFDREVSGWSRLVRGRLVPPWPVAELPQLKVTGEHNRINAVLATAAASAVGASPAAVRAGLANFVGLPHRLELVAQVEGRRFYSDSKATTPEATMAALTALDGPLWLLAGGYDKKVSFAALSTAIARGVAGVALFGAVRERLRELVASQNPTLPSMATEHLGDALEWCWRSSRPGDAIVLSPACASFDQFRDYAERGERFVKLAGRYQQSARAWS